MLQKLKKIVEDIPYPIGSKLARVPFGIRLGSQYRKFRDKITYFEEVNEQEKNEFIIESFSRIFDYSKKNHKFYNELYKKTGVYDLKINSIEDIKKVPVINKQMIRPAVDSFSGPYRLNTGGTSGTPLLLYGDEHLWAREWAHMHRIWEFLGYDYKKLKLTFRGRDIKGKKIKYNPVHNEFVVNMFMPVSDILEDLVSILEKYPIEFIHGYPSAIFNFLNKAEKIQGTEKFEETFKNVKKLLLSSDFPQPHMTNFFILHGLDYISWYGHTEMAILAYDLGKNNKYIPFVTYGYPEVECGHLLGTSFNNFSMPLIRYDTGDLVDGDYYQNGLLRCFSIKEGRIGDFATDLEGTEIPLNPFIFGRHHAVFEMAENVQVRQSEPGKLTLIVIGMENKNYNIKELFDLQNVNMDFSLEYADKPVLTSVGKMKLRVD